MISSPVIDIAGHQIHGTSKSRRAPRKVSRIGSALAVFEGNIQENKKHGYSTHDLLGKGSPSTHSVKKWRPVSHSPNLAMTPSPSYDSTSRPVGEDDASYYEVTESSESWTEVTIEKDSSSTVQMDSDGHGSSKIWQDLQDEHYEIRDYQPRDDDAVNYESAPVLDTSQIESPVPQPSPTSVAVIFDAMPEPPRGKGPKRPKKSSLISPRNDRVAPISPSKSSKLKKIKSARIISSTNPKDPKNSLSKTSKSKSRRGKKNDGNNSKVKRSRSKSASKLRSGPKRSKSTARKSKSKSRAAVRIQSLIRGALARKSFARSRELRRRIADIHARMRAIDEEKGNKLEALRAKNDAKKQHLVRETQAAISVLRSETQSSPQLNATLKSSQKMIQRLRAENESMREKKRNLAAKISKMEDKNERVRASNEDMEGSLATLRDALPQLEADRRTLLRSYDAYRKEALPAHRAELASCDAHLAAEQRLTRKYGACLKTIAQRVATGRGNGAVLESVEKILAECKAEITSVKKDE